MHGREFCMRWIIHGWPAIARTSIDVGPPVDGLDPWLTPNRCLWLSMVTHASVSVQFFGAEGAPVLWLRWTAPPAMLGGECPFP